MSIWFKANTLDDGWYWWKAGEDDYEPEVLEVTNGVVVDSRPLDSYGAVWEVYEHDNFGGLWSGPIEIPSGDKNE